MASSQGRSRPTIEVLKVGAATVSDGILSIPLHVNVADSVHSEGDIVLVLSAPEGQILSSQLQARVPQALRQWNGGT